MAPASRKSKSILLGSYFVAVLILYLVWLVLPISYKYQPEDDNSETPGLRFHLQRWKAARTSDSGPSHENAYQQQEPQAQDLSLRASSTSRHRRLNPSVGSFELLVLLVYFPEHANRTRPSRDYFESLCRNDIADYLRRQSYGLYNITSCRVPPWTPTDHSQSYYAAGVGNLRGRDQAASFFLPVLTALDHNSALNWSDLDRNGDGALDAVLVLHSGYAAEYQHGSSCGAPHSSDRIHSQGHAQSQTGWTTTTSSDDGSSTTTTYSLSGYAIASAYDWVCNENRPATMGVLTHELLHTLTSSSESSNRAPLDLYDASTGRIGGIASFGVMASSVGPARNGRPAAACAYTKERLGWLSYQEITANGDYTLRTSNRYPDALVIRQGFASAPDEYLLLEYRQAVDDDIDLFGGGLLIYHVDDGKMLQGVGGHPWQTDNGGWPANGRHYRVALLPADGNYDLERGLNNGDAGDFWTTGRTLGPSHGNNGQQPVYPNTDSYQNGTNIYPTNISIAVLEQSGEQIRIRVSGMTTDPLSLPSSSLPPNTVTTTLQPTTAQPAAPPPPTTTAPSRGSAPSPPTSAPSRLATSPPTTSPTLLRRPSSQPSGRPHATTTTHVPTEAPSRRHQGTTTVLPKLNPFTFLPTLVSSTHPSEETRGGPPPSVRPQAQPSPGPTNVPTRRSGSILDDAPNTIPPTTTGMPASVAPPPPPSATSTAPPPLSSPSPQPQQQPSNVGREADEGSGSSPPPSSSSSSAASVHTRRGVSSRIPLLGIQMMMIPNVALALWFPIAAATA